MITTCTDCHALYEAGSEEQANEPERWCAGCRVKRGIFLPPGSNSPRRPDAPTPEQGD
jgi:hypothetical protein